MRREDVEEITRQLGLFATRFTDDEFRAYVAANSRLPGPRANLEFADAFARAVRGQEAQWRTMWTLCTRWTATPPKDAPTDDPREFVVFCGARGLGALGMASPARATEALVHLRTLARDPRWRVREAVAMAIQDLAADQTKAVLGALRHWVAPGAWLEMRAVAAGLAEPRVLEAPKAPRTALEMHEDIVRYLRKAEDRSTAEFRTLRQCLAYSVSVVVAAAPEEGFRWMMRLAESEDPDVQWIVRENLKKGRLANRHPEWVKRIQATMRRA